MKKSPYYLFIILLGSVLMMANSRGRAGSANAGNTGAPGDAAITCITCHGQSTINVEPQITVMDDNGETVTSYIPGTRYRVRATVDFISGNEPEAYGFQMVALRDSDDSDLAAFSNPDANTALVTPRSTERQYAEHPRPNRDTNYFEVDWTAPEQGTGDITFYTAAVGVNGNGSTGGDGAATTTFALSEDDASSTSSVLARSIQVFPTLATDRISIVSELALASVRLVSHHGSEVNISASADPSTLDISTLTPGVYYVLLETVGGDRLTRRIIKQ